MKIKYTQPIERNPQTDAFGLYFNHKAYSIKPLNFKKRVRVFINQLLPDIVKEAETVSDIEFAQSQIAKYMERFVFRLVKEGMYKQADEAQFAGLSAIAELTLKLGEVKKNESLKRYYEITKQNK